MAHQPSLFREDALQRPALVADRRIYPCMSCMKPDKLTKAQLMRRVRCKECVDKKVGQLGMGV